MISTVSFFTYHPNYTSYTIYCFCWLYVASYLLIEVLAIIAINVWSKRVLTIQISNHGHEIEIDKLKRKRNQKAVGILNVLTIVYTISTFPLSCYYYLGVLLLMNKDNGDER